MLMRNPWWRLKTLPWLGLLQNAGLTISLATLVDLVLFQLLALLVRQPTSAGIARAVLPLLGWLLPLVAAFGIGALAVVLLERFFDWIPLNTSTLWALVPCLGLILFIKGLIPEIPALAVGLSYQQLVVIVVGVFVQGRRHWRY